MRERKREREMEKESGPFPWLREQNLTLIRRPFLGRCPFVVEFKVARRRARVNECGERVSSSSRRKKDPRAKMGS